MARPTAPSERKVFPRTGLGRALSLLNAILTLTSWECSAPASAIAAPVSVSGTPIPLDSTNDQFLAEFFKQIESHGKSAESVQIQWGTRTFTVQLPPLGKGQRGIVFRLSDGNVIKFALPGEENVRILKDELENGKFWKEQSQRGAAYSVPEIIDADPEKQFIIRSYAPHETLAELLLRYQVMKVNPDGKTLSLMPPSAEFDTHPELKKVGQALKDLFKAIQEHPENAVSLSPLNLHVEYEDPQKTRIKGLSLVDVGRSIDTLDRYGSIRDIESYLKVAQSRMESTMAKDETRIKYLDFDSAQKSGYIEVDTLGGAKVRLYGLDESLNSKMIQTIRQVFRRHGISLYNLFYYGSRVMPRSEVIRRVPELEGVIPVAEKGVVKDRLRLSGITNISDLDLILFTENPLDLTLEAELKRDIFKALHDMTREFPINFKIFQVPERASPATQFAVMNKYYADRNRTLNKLSIASAKDQKINRRAFAKPCPTLYQSLMSASVKATDAPPAP